MEMILALAVVIAVIIFGALVSVGNERKRKALDGICEQAALWAVQDLRLKREKLAKDVKVNDPVNWLNGVVAKACGEFLDLNVTETFDSPQLWSVWTRMLKGSYCRLRPQGIFAG